MEELPMNAQKIKNLSQMMEVQSTKDSAHAGALR